jgi:hypothetical protein
MRPVNPVNMARRSVILPEPKSIESLVEEGIAVARKTQLKGRREDLHIGPERIEALRLILEREGGRITWPLEYAVEFLNLSPSYLNASKSFLMASSLSRRLSGEGIRVGAREKGKFLVFKFRTERKHKG